MWPEGIILLIVLTERETYSVGLLAIFYEDIVCDHGFLSKRIQFRQRIAEFELLAIFYENIVCGHGFPRELSY